MAHARGSSPHFGMLSANTTAPTERLQRILEWIAPARGTPIEAWRQRILAAVLLALTVFGLVAYFPSVSIALAAEEYAVVVLDTVAYVGIVATLLARRASYVARAAVVLGVNFLLAVFFLVGFGFWAAGFEWLMAFPILAAVLLGLRAGLYSVAASALVLTVVGALIPSGTFLWAISTPAGLPNASLMWIVNSLSVLLLTLLITLSVGVLFDGLGNEASARRVAEAEAARLATAVEQSDGMVMLLDTHCAIRYANASALALLGAEATTVLRDACDRVLHGEPWAGTLHALITGGAPLPLSGTISPVRDEHGAVQYLLATLRDVRREQALEQRLQQGQKLEAIGTLAGGIAHDFNNLLQPILLNTESVQRLLPSTSPAQPLLDDVQHAAASARALVRRILTFTRAMEHERHPIDLSALVRESERLLRTSLPASIRLETHLTPQVTVQAEPGELQQLLLNLTTNAAHAMPAGGTITITVTRETVAATTDLAASMGAATDIAVLTVRDTGTGMDEATMARAFDPFFTTKDSGRGTGLGLAMVHGTVTALGGHIVPRSVPGVGTSMRIVLPTTRMPETMPPAARHAPSITGPRRVVLVDDDAAVLQATARLLTRFGWQVEAFGDACAAADRLTRVGARVDLLLTDLSMPGTTGLELADRVRPVHPDLPFVLATGYLEHDDVNATLTTRVSCLLTKPFTSHELQAALDAAVTS